MAADDARRSARVHDAWSVTCCQPASERRCERAHRLTWIAGFTLGLAAITAPESSWRTCRCRSGTGAISDPLPAVRTYQPRPVHRRQSRRSLASTAIGLAPLAPLLARAGASAHAALAANILSPSPVAELRAPGGAANNRVNTVESLHGIVARRTPAPCTHPSMLPLGARVAAAGRPPRCLAGQSSEREMVATAWAARSCLRSSGAQAGMVLGLVTSRW